MSKPPTPRRPCRRPDCTTGTCIDSTCDTVHSARCVARSTSHIGDNIQQSSIFMASRVSYNGFICTRENRTVFCICKLRSNGQQKPAQSLHTPAIRVTSTLYRVPTRPGAAPRVCDRLRAEPSATASHMTGRLGHEHDSSQHTARLFRDDLSFVVALLHGHFGTFFARACALGFILIASLS